MIDRLAIGIEDNPYAVATCRHVESLWRFVVPRPEIPLNHRPFGRCRLTKPIAGPQKSGLGMGRQAIAGNPSGMRHRIGDNLASTSRAVGADGAIGGLLDGAVSREAGFGITRQEYNKWVTFHGRGIGLYWVTFHGR